jgi:alkylhydroperoxidase family enzyme
MGDLFLPEVEASGAQSSWGEAIESMRVGGVEIPQILHLFNFKPDWTRHLAEFSQAVMRGPSPLTPGERELIAAFTSRSVNCHF